MVWRPNHYTCLKALDGQLWHLDSLRPMPTSPVHATCKSSMLRMLCGNADGRIFRFRRGSVEAKKMELAQGGDRQSGTSLEDGGHADEDWSMATPDDGQSQTDDGEAAEGPAYGRNFGNRALSFFRSRPSATMDDLDEAMRERYNYSKEAMGKYSESAKKAFRRAQEMHDVDRKKAHDFLQKHQCNHYVAAQKILSATPDASLLSVKMGVRAALGGLGRSGEQKVEKAWNNFKASREDKAKGVGPEEVGSPRRTGGEKNVLSVWNACVQCCAELKSSGSALPSVRDLAIYVAQHSTTFRDMCDRARSQAWPDIAIRTDQEEKADQEEVGKGTEETREDEQKAKEVEKTRSDKMIGEQARYDLIIDYLKGKATKGPMTKGKWQALRRQAGRYRLTGDVLHKIQADGVDVRVILSWDEVKDMVNFAHGKCHFGRDATLAAIEKVAWWPGNMQADVLHVIKRCEVCRRFNPTQLKIRPPMKPVGFPSRVFGLVGIDMKTLPACGIYNNILVIVDYFSKFTFVEPLDTLSAGEVADAIAKCLFLKHGSPEMMLVDNGGAFRGEIANVVRAKFNVSPRFTSPYRPQSNGLCERTNGVIATVLGKLMTAGTYNEDWAYYIDEAVFGYNTKPHTTTKKTPYKIVYGRICQTWVNLELQQSGKRGNEDASEGEKPQKKVRKMNAADEEKYQEDLEKRRVSIKDGVEFAQAAATRRHIKDYNKRHNVGHLVLKTGDSVMMTDLQRSKMIGKGRLMPKYRGPYYVAKVNKFTVQLRDEHGNLTKNVHTTLLKKVDDAVA